MNMRKALVSTLNSIPEPIARRLTSDSLGSRIARPFVNRLFPRKPVDVAIRSGLGRDLKMQLYLREEKFYLSGTYEPGVQQAMKSVLNHGDVFWDIGAHAGYFTLIGARLVGPTGRVHSFEPLPENRARLSRAIELNRCSNITVHGHAMARVKGEATLYADESTSMWTLVPPDQRGEGIRVECRTVDEVARSTKPPTLIKVDAERAEVDILRGAKNLLASDRPTLILEFSDDGYLQEAQELLPSYSFEQLSGRHWLLRSDAATSLTSDRRAP